MNETRFNSVLLSIGANLPGQTDSSKEQVRTAIARIAKHSFTILSRSRLFRTASFPAGSGPDFVNAALLCETTLSPRSALEALHGIEADLGRVRGARWAARVIDIDLIAHGEAVLPDLATYLDWVKLPPDEQAQRAPEDLILPHPRLQDRGFVLVPLMDVASDWRHPVTGRTVRQMHAALDPAICAEIWPLDG